MGRMAEERRDVSRRACLAIFTTVLTGSLSERQADRAERKEAYTAFLAAMYAYDAPLERCEAVMWNNSPAGGNNAVKGWPLPAPPWPDSGETHVALAKVSLVAPREVRDAALFADHGYWHARRSCRELEQRGTEGLKNELLTPDFLDNLGNAVDANSHFARLAQDDLRPQPLLPWVDKSSGSERRSRCDLIDRAPTVLTRASTQGSTL